MRHRRELSHDEIVPLHVDQRLTLAEVGRRLGYPPVTVARRLMDFGVALRPRGPTPRPSDVPSIAWTADLAWVVGIIATDGNLSGSSRRLAIVSKDRQLLETVRRCLGINARAATHGGTRASDCYRLQWTDRALHEWLLTIGLMPKKSLRLGPIDIPDSWFRDFFRGCIYTDRHHTRIDERYVYERLWISLVSASRPFIVWIAGTALRLCGVQGSVTVSARRDRSPLWKLRYGKRASLDLITWMYYANDVACLARKREIAEAFVANNRTRRRLNEAKQVE